jgi:hypothetical protein
MNPLIISTFDSLFLCAPYRPGCHGVAIRAAMMMACRPSRHDWRHSVADFYACHCKAGD